MAKFSASGSRTAAASKTVVAVNAAASAMRRVKLYYIAMGSEGVPADLANSWTVARSTAAGTSTSFTGLPLDAADAAFSGACGFNHSVEPTYTAGGTLLYEPLNQKATLQWQAPPGGELVVPATASNGIGVGLYGTVGSSVATSSTVHFEEQ